MVVVGICGSSGAGKSYISQRLIEALGKENVCYLPQDHYYRPRELQPFDSNGIQNFDTTQSIDLVQYQSDVGQILQGKPVVKKEYVYNNPKVVPTTLTFYPAPVLLLEGLMLFYPPELRTVCNLKIFVDAPLELQLERRIKRDAVERGYDRSDVTYRFHSHVMPLYNECILPYKTSADVILNNEGENLEPQIAVVLDRINSMMKVV